MDRRHFLRDVLSGAALGAFTLQGNALWGQSHPQRMLLSAQGCGRATGYAEANKIVSWDGKTHVSWLDSTSEGFKVRIRTLDRATGQWSPVYTIGDAHDNHGGPALAVDSKGYLHVVFYPHHHPFRYRKSRLPNDASEWEKEVQFGTRCTYPTLVCGADDTLYLTGRRSFGDRPWHVELWTKARGDSWRGPSVLVESRHRGYSHFQESLAWGPDHRTLHLCCRIHENSDKSAYGRLQTVGYMVSRDLGQTWQTSDGSPIALPATAETIDVLESGGVDVGRELRAGSLAVDTSGTPFVVYSISESGEGQTVLARPGAGGEWHRSDLCQFLPQRWSGWNLIMPGGVSLNHAGHLFVAAMLQKPKDGDSSWGHATNEIAQFVSTDGGETFSLQLRSPVDENTPHWLPNIEKATGHNRIAGRPGLIYTAGSAGEKNTDILSNDVYWVDR